MIVAKCAMRGRNLKLVFKSLDRNGIFHTL